MNVRRLVVTCAACLLALAAPRAAVGWTHPRPLAKERGTDPVGLHVAVDDAGNAAFLWIRGNSVRARLRTSGGHLSKTTTIRRSRYGFMALPQIALGPHGRAAAIWEEQVSRGPASRWNVFAAVRSHGRFGKARRLGVSRAIPYGGSGAGAQGDSPKVAVDKSGNVLFLWRRDDSSLQAVRRTARGRFEPVRTIIARSGKDLIGAFDISLGFDGRGTAYAAWTSYNNGTSAGGVRVAAWPRRASRFGVPQIVSTPGESASQARMAVGNNGTVAVIWRHAPGGDPAESDSGPIEVAVARSGAGFAAPQRLDPTCDGTSPNVAVGGTGEAFAIWRQTCGVEQPLVGAVAVPGGSFGPVEPIYSGPPDLSGAIYATVAAGGSGQAVVAFSPGFSASVRGPGGPFGPPRRIAASPGYATTPRLAAGRRLAIAAWQGKGGFFYSTLRFSTATRR